MAIMVNCDRLKFHLTQLGKVGAVEGHGVTRLSFSKEYETGRELVASFMKEAGMTVEVDPVGNLIGTRQGKCEQAILLGSHIDSVLEGGIYDGCLGVLGAVEAVHTLEEMGIETNHTIKVAAFIEEEGGVVGGLLGSRVYCGLPLEEGFIHNFHKVGITPEVIDASKNHTAVKLYLELHIEQGGILDNQEIDVGVVQAIVGILRWNLSIKGTVNHAGSTPMYLRDDALVKAAKFIVRFEELVKEKNGMVGTIGCINALPGAPNIIPGKVDLTLEMRSVSYHDMENVWNALKAEFLEEFSWEETFRQEPVLMDDNIQTAISTAASELGLSTLYLVSGAGHDTQSMAEITKTGMIFVPSIKGISHAPEEQTTWEACANGASVLLSAVLKLDEE